MNKYVILASMLFASSSSFAQAPYDWAIANARVSSIEATYMPSQLVFKIDKPVGTCAAGALLHWQGQGEDQTSQYESTKAILALLMAAKLSDSTIRIYGFNNNCEVKFIYLE
jgi:hypothetical protein